MGLLKACRLLKTSSRLQTHLRRRSLAVAQEVDLLPGQNLCGYTIDKVVPIPELYLTAVLLTHDKTGASHLHISRDDDNNVFGVAFRTTPRDSTGVPHILEHTALCGSQKYPVRDPFFKMLNRSLSTFMNAFTASDWTMYPFSTRNAQDYQNLMGVYLDASFFPLLREQDFRQEGWRLEHENLADKNSPIVFKGVVYNEMKGVFSDSRNLFASKAQNHLLPGHTYGVVSGGDPENIPDLTWQQLRDFHATHYHPSNARFYTYGNIPLERTLEFIDSQALSKFDHIETDTEVPLEERWQEPKSVHISCPSDPMAPDPDKQTTVAVCYLLNDITDAEEAFTLSLLGYLLTQGETSPFSRSLLEANLGSDFSPVIGYDGNTRESSFSVGLQGIHGNDLEKVKSIIQETLETVVKEGFEQERIDAVLHTIELGMKHQYEKFGLYLGVSLLPAWTHGADVTEILQLNKMVENFQENLKNNPRFLQEKVKKYFLENPHRLTLTMSPDPQYDEVRQKKEQEKLQSYVSNLGEQDKEKILEAGLQLAELQNQNEDISCLPTLKVSDIEKVAAPVHTTSCLIGGVPTQLCEQPTNTVTYFRAVSSLNDLPDDLLPYVPLFCGVVTKMGAGGKDFKALSQEIDLRTGGMGASCSIIEHHTQSNTYEQGVLFSSYCLDKNINHMFNLWSDIFTSLDMSDSNRFRTLVMMTASDLTGAIAHRGHTFAMGHASSSLTPAAKQKELLAGMEQVLVVKQIAEMQDHGDVVKKLQDIANHLLNKNHIRCALNSTPEGMSDAQQGLETFLNNLECSKLSSASDNYMTVDGFQMHPCRSHFQLPFQVNYISRSVLTVPFTHPDFASLRILGNIMTHKFLHREIREKGGAYGGGAGGGSPGFFNFYSYRDPNSVKTLEAFDASVEWATRGNFTSQDIDEAKLSIFSQVDMPIPPGDRGLRFFLTGISDELRQKHREQLFAVNKDSLVNATLRYLTPENRISSVSFLGPENPLSKDSPDWIIKKPE